MDKRMGLIVNRKTGTPRVQWESNGLVKRNPTINPDDIFDKCPTNEFPDGASVRITSQKNGHATVYFKSPLKTRTFGSGKNSQSYTYCDATLKVSLPVCLLYTSPSPRDGLLSRMPSSA